MGVKKLEAGDLVVRITPRGTIEKFGKVSRVTATQAVAGGLKFRRESRDGGGLSLVGGSGYSFYSYRVADIEDLEKLDHMARVSEIRRFDFENDQTMTTKVYNLIREAKLK